MANIREYTKKREQGKNESLSQKIIRHRLQIIYRTLLAIILVAALSAVIVLQIKNRVYETYEVTSSIDRKVIEDSYTLAFNGNILTYSRDGANCVDPKGGMIWNQPFEMQNPMVDIAGDKAAFGDYNGSVIYLFDTNGLLGQIDTKMPLRSLRVARNGMIAAILDGGSVTWIYLFSSSGDEVAYFKTSMQKSGYPVAVGISPNGKLVGVSHLQVETGAMVSSVAFYNFDKVGKNNIDNYASGYDYPNEVVPELRFMDNETAFAVSDSRIMFYRGGEKPVMQKETLLKQEVKGVFYNESYVGLVYYDVTGTAAYKLEIYDKDGKLYETVDINFDYTKIMFHKEKVLIYNDTECQVHNIGGADIFDGKFEKSVYAIIPLSAVNRYLLVTKETIDTIELK